MGSAEQYERDAQRYEDQVDALLAAGARPNHPTVDRARRRAGVARKLAERARAREGQQTQTSD